MQSKQKQDKVLNPASGRYVLATGDIGKTVLAARAECDKKIADINELQCLQIALGIVG